ncbi:MAG: 4Fe-4S binding protein [Proteobacteria bacterium]|nr:4Fe-4S binding protein [Pseudomonadota bacterium]
MDLQGQDGLLHTYREPWRRRAPAAWLLGALLFLFYLTLYFSDYLDPVARAAGLPNRWFLYGALYSLAMTAGAVYYLKRHGNSRYNRVRIAVNVAVQYVLAFLLPYAMFALQQKDYYFSYLWPLKIDALYPSSLTYYPLYIGLYAIGASLVAAPVLAVVYGKRWYCSWICGCGGLANTFGDPFRHLADKSTKSWRLEQVSVHLVLLVAITTTALVGLDFFIGDKHPGFHAIVGDMRSGYGLVAGAILSGVVGVGVYPVLGPRVWCRFFCPMAAMLGLFQKLGRFRIRVKPNMCISCGNCSAYCEMGIDVRSYAQSNTSFTRASCVGCGMCAHVCPRGVLRLESSWPRSKDKARQQLRVLDI